MGQYRFEYSDIKGKRKRVGRVRVMKEKTMIVLLTIHYCSMLALCYTMQVS